MTAARRDEALEALAEFLDREPWEPFVPVIGQRVRVRVSPECGQAGHLDPNNPEEWDWLERDTGVVVCIGDRQFRGMFPDGHWYGVIMDDWLDLSERLFGYSLADYCLDNHTPQDWYAAVELERIDHDAD